MTVHLEKYTLPEHIACYAMYGDPSGNDELDEAYDLWLDSEMSYHGFTSMDLVDVKESGFMAHHELKPYGIGSCDTSEFIFFVTLLNYGV